MINFIADYLRERAIKIDLKEFEFQVKTHPNYPSILSYNDALIFFGIETFVGKVPNKVIDKIPDEFITIVKTKNGETAYAFVKRESGIYKLKVNSEIHKLKKDEFLEVWQNVILVAEETGNTIKKQVSINSVIGYVFGGLGISFLILMSINPYSYSVIFYWLIAFSGLYLSIEAVKEEMGIESTFVSAVCGSHLRKNDCNSVISSTDTKLVEILRLSDLGLVFFLGLINTLILMSANGLISAFIFYSLIVLSASILVTFYSLYYQWRIAKKWCTLCLMIIGVLYIGFSGTLYLSSFSEEHLTLYSALTYSIGFLFSLSFWLIVKPSLKHFIELNNYKVSSEKFKRNYTLFGLALKNSQKLNYETLRSPFQVGNRNARLKITLVTNPFCSFCSNTNKLVKEILNKNYENVLVNFRFNLDWETATYVSKKLHVGFAEIYFKHGEKSFLGALEDWFTEKDFNRWNKTYEFGGIDDKMKQILSQQYEQNKTNSLMFTPTLIIGEYVYPKMYGRQELSKFVSNLIDDEQFFVKNQNHFKESY